MLYFGKTSYKDFLFAQREILRIVVAPNEAFRLIIIHYMFKYSFVIKTSFLKSLRNQKRRLKARFLQN